MRIAPCRRSQISGGIASTASTTAAARGSVARASAFSSSVSTSVRRLRISSISVPSNRSVGLSGASCGWSARMIGLESSRSERPSGPASTGQVCRLSSARVAGRAHSGGSVADRNAPAVTATSVCAAMSDVRSATSRGAPSGQAESLTTSMRSRRTS